MGILLGLDQGSTKTHALVARTDGSLLAMGEAPGSLHTQQGMADALACMGLAADRALEKVGLTRTQVTYVSGGLSGIDYPYEQDLLTREVGAYFGVRNVYVHNDCIGALWGGTLETPAVVCCAGTGLNVGGADERGQPYQFGNYCNCVYQGGGSIGQLALQEVFDAHIGKCRTTLLTERILAFTDTPDVDTLLLRRYRRKDIVVSKLCPVVFQVAGEGDAAAARILCECGKHWAGFILSMIHRLGLDPERRIPVVLSGSVFKGKPAIPREVIEKMLIQHVPGAVLTDARFEPVVGGAVMGLQRIGEPNWQERVGQTAKQLNLLREEKNDTGF